MALDQNQDTRTSHYRARSAAWSIRTDDQQVRALLDEVFADVVGPPSAEGTHFDIRGDDIAHGVAPVIDDLVGFLNQEVLRTATNTLDLHASAMTHPSTGITVVTTAPSGGGKTTMAAHLCRAGWSYLSDETVGIDLDDGSLIGDGKPLTVKEGLHATLGIDLAPLTVGAELQRRWYVRPALLGGSIAPPPSAPPPTDLVFIQFDPTATATEVRPVPPHQALLQLLSNTYQLDRLGARVLPTLARLVSNARTWEVRTGDGADAVDQLLAAIDGRPRPDRGVVLTAAPSRQGAPAGPVPSAGTVFAGFSESGAVVHDHVRSQAVALDPVGAMVWQLLDGSVSTPELADELADHFEMPAGTIAVDIDTLCSDLVAQGFLATPD